ncbi:MAG TPA: 8-amino-7-oxononanoate synthase [Polyangia bacterium]|nr:8-amino-7-oxononanoate synthase [Polyangia bacterium]
MRDLSKALDAELAELRRQHRHRACPEVTGASRQRAQLGDRTLISFCSNDYLGLASHPAVLAAAAETARLEGFGAGAARLVAGDLPSHRALESDLAEYLERPATLLFPSGYQANLGVVTALAGPDDLIASDAANHASLIDGCRLSKATIAIYAHGDHRDAARALARPGSFRRRLLVTESLFSMDGDAAPLVELSALATEHDAVLIVDEAHALGVCGPGGRGLCAEAAVSPDVLIGTLGKAFGAAGGFASGASVLRDYLVNRARTFVFATAMPPAVAGAARLALQLSASADGDARRARLRSHRLRLVAALGERIPDRPGAILPVILGSDDRALAASALLRERGLFVPAIRPPTVAQGTARLRVTFSSEHTSHEVEDLAAALAEVLD